MPASLSRLWRTALFNALRFAFRLAPLPQSTRDRLRQRFLDNHAGLVLSGPRGRLDSTRTPRRPYARADERAIGYVPYSTGELPDPLPATLIAFYLPQFHSIPENDEWWGKGFTEWRNVTRALPQFEGHAQPRLPGDLGFYDLRDPEVMRNQSRLAREYGIGAFCFYFYWFGGKTLLETPLRNWLADRTLDLPFCLCWANEKWSRTWDGRGQDILIDQCHSERDDLAFIAHVSEYLHDPRYLRIEGKPLLLVYRPGLLPDAKATAARWRKWCLENGVGHIHIACVQGFERFSPESIGFDSAVQFPPNLGSPAPITGKQQLVNPDYSGQVLDWRELAREFQQTEPVPYVRYPGVSCGWDNEPRRPGKGRTFLHSAPRRYRDWLGEIIRAFPAGLPTKDRLIFINAWNEWAEGAILEPDARLGYAYLSATRQAHAMVSPQKGTANPCVVVHAWHLDAFEQILCSLRDAGIIWRLFVTTTPENERQVVQRLQKFDMEHEVIVSENRGRDILPFLRLANRLLDDGHDVVLKLHTKRSTHLKHGDQWRKELVDRLVGNSRAATVLAAFDKQQDLGMVAAEGHILPVDKFIGANGDDIEYLTTRFGLEGLNEPDRVFASGSMFWVRLKALRPMLDACLDESEFESEAAQIDGTLAHAIERMFAVCVRSAGFGLQSVAEACGEHPPAIDSYPYAREK